MKRFLLVAVLLSVPAILWAWGYKETGREEAPIRMGYAAFATAWSKDDAHAMSLAWAEDGDHVDPDGQVAKGRKEIEKLLAEQHATVFKGTHLAMRSNPIFYIKHDMALVDGTYEVTGAHDKDGKALPPLKGLFTDIWENNSGRWEIIASRTMIPSPPIGQSN
jgi:uncharacterized protein (TIGR02246 family)